jgi:hypothetical protein
MDWTILSNAPGGIDKSSVISSVIEVEKSADAGKGTKPPATMEDAKSLRLREMIAKPLISLGFAKSRAMTPTLSVPFSRVILREKVAGTSLGGGASALVA